MLIESKIQKKKFFFYKINQKDCLKPDYKLIYYAFKELSEKI